MKSVNCVITHFLSTSSGIYGGNQLGVRSVSGLAFYDWESTDLIRRIEITPKHVSCTPSCHLIIDIQDCGRIGEKLL